MDYKEELKKGTYEGYYWMSDATSPVVLVNELFPVELDDTKNPFVIEAQLFDKSRHMSFSVKYVDGEYIIKDFDVTKDELSSDEIEKFLPNKMEDVEHLKFIQRWTEEDDELCEGKDVDGKIEWMKVLKPEAFIFVGFEFKDKERK